MRKAIRKKLNTKRAVWAKYDTPTRNNIHYFAKSWLTNLMFPEHAEIVTYASTGHEATNRRVAKLLVEEGYATLATTSKGFNSCNLRLTSKAYDEVDALEPDMDKLWLKEDHGVTKKLIDGGSFSAKLHHLTIEQTKWVWLHRDSYVFKAYGHQGYYRQGEPVEPAGFVFTLPLANADYEKQCEAQIEAIGRPAARRWVSWRVGVSTEASRAEAERLHKEALKAYETQNNDHRIKTICNVASLEGDTVKHLVEMSRYGGQSEDWHEYIKKYRDSIADSLEDAEQQVRMFENMLSLLNDIDASPNEIEVAREKVEREWENAYEADTKNRNQHF